MFRVLIFLSLLISGTAMAATFVFDGCYTGCEVVDNDHLVCDNDTTCSDSQHAPFGWSLHGNIQDAVNQDTAYYHNGSEWIQAAKNRHDGTAFVATDHEWDKTWLEGIYMVLFPGVYPTRPGYKTVVFDNNQPLPLDNDTFVDCTRTTVDKIYGKQTAGDMVVVPVDLACGDNDTWSGLRTFFLAPSLGMAGSAILFFAQAQADCDNRSVGVSLTGYGDKSFVTRISLCVDDDDSGCGLD